MGTRILDIQISSKDNKTHILLPAQFHEQAIDAFRRAVLDSENDVVIVEGEAVEKVGTAGAQILLAARRHLEQAGGRMIVMKPSDVLGTTLRELGLDKDLLGLTD